ncbi:MAG: protein kinase [Planctomycetaceae bacterium]|nr:protein kinase [Planctomycetaceae bacterium]
MAKQLLQPPSHPEMLGRLGRYEIERLVGSGGMGVVFKAYDSELHRSVAIKMLAPHLSGSRSARERFAREARAAAAIVNDHVVPIHNVETDHATPYLVMQYIAGDSLQARLDRDGPLDVCEILRIGMQVASGLAAAHAQGLIHRDVKPSNIMLDENVARALLTDFGLARTQDDAAVTRSGFHPGTPHYMSPEQVRGEELDGRSDLFSLGCVLYALCTGHPPYRAASGYAVMRRITDESPRSIREQNTLIPEWLERLVMRLLEKDRKARIQSAEELARILEQCLAHVQRPATETLPLAVAPKTSFFGRGRIRGWILAGMASAFLFFLGVLIVIETNKGTITIHSEADNVPIRIKRSDQVVEEMVVSRSGKSVRLAAGEYVIEFEDDSQDLVVEGGNVSLVRGDTKTLQIAYRKSVAAETQRSADKSESKVDKSEVSALAQSVSLAAAIEAFNRDHSAELIAANSPLLTEDELCAALWWHANHVDFSPAPRHSLLEIVLNGRLLAGWSIQLKNVQWDEEKRWHDQPATSRAIEINLVNQEQYVAPIRFQFTSSGLGSKVPANSPLADAIVEFNKHEAGEQPPLTLQETLAALSTLWSKEPDRHPEEAKPSDDAVIILKQLADQHTMDGHTIESSLQEHEVGDSKFLTWKIELRVKAHEGFLGTQWFTIRKRFIKVDSDRISARRSQVAALHTYKQPANVSDFSMPKASVSISEGEDVSGLASAVDHFNRVHTEKMQSANTPPLTEDELVASLWWQYKNSDLTEELKEVAREVALTRAIPDGWSLGLRLTKWDDVAFWKDTEKTKSLEICMTHGHENVITIRRHYMASPLITSWTYRDESPLRSAIANFNSQYSTSEPAITYDEVMAALSTIWEHYPDRSRNAHQLTEESFQALLRLSHTHEMQEFAFERIQSFDLADGDKFSVWSVRLTSPERDRDGKTLAFEIRKRFLKVESDQLSARIKEPTAPHPDKTPTPLFDLSNKSTVESDLTAAVDEFNQLHSEKLRASNLPPLTEDELVASLWWQYSQSKLREEISENVKEIVITRKLPPGWSIKLDTRSWTLPQQWWHESPLGSSALQVNLLGKEGLATTIRNQFVSSDASSLRPPESALEKAIDEFNQLHSELEPRLTLPETLAALSTLWGKQSWFLSDGLKPTTMDTLIVAIDRDEMKGVKLELLRSYETENGGRFSVWSIRLVVQDDQDGSTEAFTIRERFQRVNSFSEETIHGGKPPTANPPVAVPAIRDESSLQSVLDSVKLMFNQGSACQDAVLTAELELVDKKIRAAKAENLATPPALLDERENLLQRAVLAAKTQYEEPTDTQLSNLESEFRIAGKCVDASDQPIENAVIELYANDRLKYKSIRTGADGAFDFGTVPDPELSADGYVHYVVVGRATGKAIGAALPFGYSGKSNDLRIVLGAPGQLKGKVTGPDGSPVSGARVSLAGLPWIDGVHGAITNETGEYVLDAIPLLEHPGMSRRRGPGFPKEGIMAPSAQQFMIVRHSRFGLFQPGYAECPATVDVRLDEPSIVKGRVVDEQGKPIAGIKVSARASQNPVHRHVVSLSQLRGVSHSSSDTNADGEYTITLQYAGPIDLTFNGSKHLAKTVNDVFVTSGQTVDAPEATAVEPAYVVGRIVDVDTDKTVACPPGVRLRVYSLGNGPVSSVIIQPDGTFRLPVLPGTTFVYFSVAPDSMRELTKLWDVLDHPNPLTAKQYPLEADRNQEVEVNFPVKVNKEKLGQILQSLQGNWEIQSGTYVAGGNAGVALSADQLLDGEKQPWRFTIHGNQWLGHCTNFCGVREPEIGMALCDGVAELKIDESSATPCLSLVRFENGKKRRYPCLYQLKGDQLELVCNASATNQHMPTSGDFLHEGFILQAKRIP